MIVKATYITYTAVAWDVLLRYSSYKIHKLFIGFWRWSDFGNTFVYMIFIFLPIGFLEVVSSSEIKFILMPISVY